MGLISDRKTLKSANPLIKNKWSNPFVRHVKSFSYTGLKQIFISFVPNKLASAYSLNFLFIFLLNPWWTSVFAQLLSSLLADFNIIKHKQWGQVRKQNQMKTTTTTSPREPILEAQRAIWSANGVQSKTTIMLFFWRPTRRPSQRLENACPVTFSCGCRWQ